MNLCSAKWKPPGPEPVANTLHTSIRAAPLSLRFLDCKIWLVILQACQSILSCLASHRSGPQQVLFLPIFSFLPSLWYSVTHTHTGFPGGSDGKESACDAATNTTTIYTCVCVCAHAKSLQLCLTLCDPMDYSPPGSSVHGILQARILEREAIPFSRGSSRPRDQIQSLMSPALAGRFFSTTWDSLSLSIYIHTYIYYGSCYILLSKSLDFWLLSKNSEHLATLDMYSHSATIG